MDKCKFFGKPARIITLVLCAIACILFIRDIVDVGTRSAYIDKDVSALTGELHNRYAHLFYASGVYGEDEMELHFIALGGNYCPGELHITEPAEITYQVKSKCGDLRVLLADKTDGKAAYDAFVAGKNGEFSLNPGDYDVYLVGNWFWGTVTMQHPTGAMEMD